MNTSNCTYKMVVKISLSHRSSRRQGLAVPCGQRLIIMSSAVSSGSWLDTSLYALHHWEGALKGALQKKKMPPLKALVFITYRQLGSLTPSKGQERVAARLMCQLPSPHYTETVKTYFCVSNFTNTHLLGSIDISWCASSGIVIQSVCVGEMQALSYFTSQPLV